AMTASSAVRLPWMSETTAIRIEARRSEDRDPSTPQAQLQMAADVGPFAGDDAVHHQIPRRAVLAHTEVADDAVLAGAERFDRPLRAEIERVGPQTDDLAAEGVERMREQQQLAGGVDVRSLPALRVPCIADLHAIEAGDDVVIARRADDGAALEIAHDPRQHVAVAL